MAYAIGRRVGSAVVRNRIRRRLRAAVALQADDLVPGGAYLLSADPGAMTQPFSELSARVRTLLQAAREDPS